MNSAWRRALRTPLILLGINLVVSVLAAGVVYGYAGNQASLRDRLASAMQSLTYQRETVADDLAYVEANEGAFDQLLGQGYLAEQDRLAAARLLDRLSERHGLNGIRYSFSPQRERPLGQGRLARITLISTEVTIEMTAVADVELLAFARSVTSGLPGDVRVLGLSLARRYDPEPDLLARLRDRQRVDLVDGRLQLEWRALRWRGADTAAAGPT